MPLIGGLRVAGAGPFLLKGGGPLASSTLLGVLAPHDAAADDAGVIGVAEGLGDCAAVP